MTITATKARALSAESVKDFKKSKSFAEIIAYLECNIDYAAKAGKTSVSSLVGNMTKTNGDALTEIERQAVKNELTANGFTYSEHVENDRLWYTVSW